MFKTLKNNTKGKLKMKQIKKPDTAIFFGTYKEMIYNSTPEQCKIEIPTRKQSKCNKRKGI